MIFVLYISQINMEDKMNWYLFLTSAAVGAVIGAFSNILIQRIKNNHEIRSYRVRELHRILEIAEETHGFSGCSSAQEISDRVLFYWGYLEIVKPLIGKKGREDIDRIITELSSKPDSENKGKLDTLNEMVRILKKTIQNQIIKLI